MFLFSGNGWRRAAAAMAVLIVLACVLTACSGGGRGVKIAVAADLHYISPRICDGGEYFSRMMENADGKVTIYAQELTEAFIAQVKAQKPDALILCGDLTLSGEKASHEDLAELLRGVQEAGIPVLLIPGNHDLDSAYAFSYAGAEHEPTETVDAGEFARIYSGLGREKALAADSGSYSFVYAVTPRLWIMLLDAYSAVPGSVGEETLAWAEKQLSAAKEQGAEVVAVTHQNVLSHNPQFAFGYLLNDSGKVEELLREGGVPLCLSGHLHIQHIAQERGLTEIVTSSLAVTPDQYGVLSAAEDGTLSYETQAVDVSAWARAQGSKNGDLLDFAAFSAAYFDGCTRRKLDLALADTVLSDGERSVMTDWAVRVNREYFGGTLPDDEQALTDAAALSLWREKAPDVFFTGYLENLTAQPGSGHNAWTSG